MIERRIDWDAIESFIGYGRIDAPVVFIGMEEGSSEPDPTADLQNRSTYPAVHRLTPQRQLQRTWRAMCDLMLRRDGHEPTREMLRQYQMEQLGQPSGETLLAELLPYPHRNISSWNDVFKQRFASRAEYEREMLPKRKQMLAEVLWAHPRDIVVGYGMGHQKATWKDYKGLAPAATWTDQGSFEVAKIGRTRFILAPHFASRAFNQKEGALAVLALG